MKNINTMFKNEATSLYRNCNNKMLAQSSNTRFGNASYDEITLLTSKQLEECLQVSHGTIWNWRKENKLKPVKIGKRVLYRLNDVRLFILGGLS